MYAIALVFVIWLPSLVCVTCNYYRSKNTLL